MKGGIRLLGNGVRVLTLMVCVLALGVSISRAQPRPPGGIGGGPPPGGIGGGPPPGGIGGAPQPGGIGGKAPPGGIGGMPQPGGIGGGPQPGGIGGGGQKIWSCDRCGKILSTGNNPPIGVTCPGCGAKIVSAIDKTGPGGGGPQPGGGGGGNPNPGKAPVVRDGAFDDPINLPPADNERQDAGRRLKMLLVLGGIGFGVIVLGAGAFGLLMLFVFYNRAAERG